VTSLYLYAAAIVIVALLVLLRPWWQARLFSTANRRTASADSLRQLNSAIYRDQLADLERDRNIGQLAEADFKEAQDELQRRLLDDASGDGISTTVTTGRATWIALLVLLPAVGVALYATIGSPQASLTVTQQERHAAASMEALVEKLSQKLAANPDNPDGWAMLARSYASMGRWDDAERAFTRIGASIETNPQLLASLAELLAQKTGGDFAGKPRDLLAKALKIDPANMLALFLSGSDAMQTQRWADAVAHWEKLMPQLEPGSEDAQSIGAGINEARSKMGMSAAVPGKPKVGASATAKPATGAGGISISGRVELATALKGKAKPGDTVFVFARAAEGPRMPLAAKRVTVAELPLDFVLDDSMAMTPEMKMSNFKEVRIEVRISPTGNAVPASGDLSGKSDIVKPGAKGLRIKIDQVIP
jgi:cytochrome c-type biogenesis protein CcmH